MFLPKLFGTLGVVLAILAATGVVRLLPWDVGVHGMYFAFSPSLVFWFCSLTSVNFAILYWAAEKFTPTHWSRALGTGHFVLFSLFTVLFTVSQLGSDVGIPRTRKQCAGSSYHGFSGFLVLCLDWSCS